jgi:hypothetical protein
MLAASGDVARKRVVIKREEEETDAGLDLYVCGKD